MDDKIKRLKSMILNAKSIVFFGGAGVSTQSNIPDFRSAHGIYNKKFKYSPEQILSHSFYLSHTEDFFDFYRQNMVFKEAKPNDAHLILARLEKEDRLKAIITQNIDGLHQKAGSKTVYELHGSVYRNYCEKCHKFYPLDYVLEAKGVPKCICKGIIKPDVVLYEEGLNQSILQKSIEAIKDADMLIVGGTSLLVYPAAGLCNYYHGDKLVLINTQKTPLDKRANLTIYAKIGDVLSEAIK